MHKILVSAVYKKKKKKGGNSLTEDSLRTNHSGCLSWWHHWRQDLWNKLFLEAVAVFLKLKIICATF